MRSSDVIQMPLADLNLLEGNPRKINKKELDRLVGSIRKNGFWPHRPLALVQRGDRLVVLAGNQRLKAARKLKLQAVPCIVYSDTTREEELDIVARDNVNNGEWDFGVIQTNEEWAAFDWGDIGLSFPEEKEEKEPRGSDVDSDDEDASEIDDEKEDFYRSMLRDVLYEANNPYDIPNLLIEKQAGKLELPFSPWGANSRLRKDVSTYHFYVDDYRFEALFKDPIKLLLSGCKAIVEPNCSCHDQTPIAYGIQLIYKKRWLSRYLQECGINVYADLNVSHKFVEYNRMGIPDGYNAFFTRGLDGWMESLKSDLQVAQEISGLERPNLIVYGGGKAVQEFCQKKGLLYVTDFINAKKI